MTGTQIDEAAVTIDRPPALEDTALFGHPRGLGLLFIVEMWERFSYYGMRGLLVLYLVNHLGWPDANAANLYGTYTALAYLTPLAGGYLADRLIGTRRSLVIGGIVIALGHFALAVENMVFFYLGLGLVAIGTGFFKPNVSTMVGQIYAPGDQRRDSGFTIFYMGINLGAFLAGIVCGWLYQEFGPSYGFGAAGVGMVLGLAVYLIYRDRYLPGIGLRTQPNPTGSTGAVKEVEANPTNPMHGVLGALLGVIVALAASGGAWRGLDTFSAWLTGNSGWLSLFFGAMVGAALGISILGSHGEERKRVIALFIVCFFVVFFWMAFEQAGSSMNLFADRNTDRVVRGFTIPTAWFQSVNAGFIILFAPLFAVLWAWLRPRGWEPSTALKMVGGLFLCGIGFLILAAGGRLADTGALVSPMWLVLAYLFQTWGELSLSPVGLSYVTKVAPLRFASLLMGVWFLANAFANKLAGSLAAYSASLTSLGEFVMIPVYTSVGAALLLLLLVPVLKRLTASVPGA